MISGIESARLKLSRAHEHIDAIRDVVWDYTEEEPSVITEHADGSAQLNFVKNPPNAISVLAGEAIYQIRSALDHLVFQLVKLNQTGITLPTDWEERCAFPIRITLPTKAPAFNCFERTLPGISNQAFIFIESVQPYNRGDVGVYLGRLAILSNIDKHRYLSVMKPQAHRRDEATVLYKGMEMITSSFTRVEDGTRTDSPYAGADVQVLDLRVGGAFTPFVSFNEPTLDPGVPAFPVADLLQECLDKVQRVIVPTLEEFIDNP